MNIDCYTITYNEEKIIDFFLDHYSKFCRNITVFDNCSTDSTADIVKRYKSDTIHIEQYNSENTLNDSIYLQIKNNCWKNSDADYVIIVDCDELLYHPSIVSFFETTSQPVYMPYGYDMVSDSFPEKGKSIIEQITEGVNSPNYSKMCVFSPKFISDINYTLGCHRATPRDIHGVNTSPYRDDELKLLHYKNISFEYRYNKHVEYNQRLSDFNKKGGSGIHYSYEKEKQFDEFCTMLNSKFKII
jgi:glycosyltransferase involved in cell wall biosynthesis